MKSRIRILLVLLLLGLALGAAQFFLSRSTAANPLEVQNFATPELYYGLPSSSYCFENCAIQPNQFFSTILFNLGLSHKEVHTLVENTKEVFDPRNIRSGRDMTVVYNKDSGQAESIVYPISRFRYLEYDLTSQCAEIYEREIERQVVSHSGEISSSLWQTMADENLPFDLIDKMEDVFAWSIDFHHIQKGDRFKLIYEELTIEDEAAGSGQIVGAVFESMGKEHHAIRFESEKYGGFFDLEGRPLKRAFLKAPVRYSRISSRYNLNRRHPVLKTNRPHFGTDYAAPHGTPIFAVANGKVLKASRTRGNGNYVKLDHKGNIQTQYLHMSRIHPDMKPGVHVKQGQVIGYVGMTGLATGNHVCFRFWKNGKQVDHLKENLPPPEPIPAELLPHFEITKDMVKSELEKVLYPAKDKSS